MLSIRRFGVPPRQASPFVSRTIEPRTSPAHYITGPRQPSAATFLNHSKPSSTAAAAVAAAPRYLAQSRLSSIGVAKQGGLYWNRSCIAERGLGVRATRARMPRMNTTGLSTFASKPSGVGLRVGRVPLGGAAKGKRVGGGSARNMSYLPQGGSSSDTIVVYGLVGLNILGTLVWVLDSEGAYRATLMENLMVSTWSTVGQGKFHTLLTTNFSHSNLWNGAICSYMVYNVGMTAVRHLGQKKFLGLYLLGGIFCQLCQVTGPIVANKLNLREVLQVPPQYFTDGGFGATLAVLAWYCFSFPSSQVVLVVVPIQTGVAGALYLGATFYSLITNGDSVPFLGGHPAEIWRTLGAVAAGGLVAFASRGRGRYQFIKTY